ncbi:type IV pilus assembly protein PilB [Desulfocicer vacuolatum DSM 3385]|uniref:Type IV pilus assembly protein PilB n=1 Tax=Desulfocicer vacuolatum DSM 3385 TaxID=1121400 RepID=A0A1W1ZR70_9BACT|nr:type IV-A pilus assembly ATPase PilB [Desulfocicer vacuolatum]SMC50712.1 type IV pilus assembly protein PilB [Desulfocicer vacuolatum DSM 3385]
MVRPTTKASKGTRLKATIKDQSGAGKERIGEILSKEGQITSLQFQAAKTQQKKNGGRLSSILLRMGHIDPDTIVSVLGRIYDYQVIRVTDMKPNESVLEMLPFETAREYMAFPLGLSDETFSITMTEPTDSSAVEALQEIVGRSLKVMVSTENDIIEAYRDYYKISEEVYKEFLHFDEEPDEEPVTSVEDFGSLVSEAAEELEVQVTEDDDYDQFMASDAPIIKLVNGILIKAINDGVSDIHIEPFEKSLQVRYRMDGSLFKAMNLPLTIKNAVISRLKILAELDIAERRIPQDGRIKLRLGRKKAVDFRVSTLPTLFGESVVMRILDQSALNVDLSKLGFERDTFDAIKRCINKPYGLLLVTGPTGSGKTTTLYSLLNRLNQDDTKILTAEDPVEFNFRGINQVPVKDSVGMTFAAALKSFLRQDPDIIMVGEIRDMDTAEIAIKAAMTGHLVFSTLHTNDCPSTIGRLMDIGIPSYMLASSVTMVLSQRLARRLCPACKQEVTGYDPVELEMHGFSKEEIPNLKIMGPTGCSQCNGTGYKGRVGLYEMMEVGDEVSKAINASVPEDQLRKLAIQQGMCTLRDAGLEKVRQGVTSLEEVLKRTNITKEALPAYLVNPDVENYEDRDVIIREGNSDNDFYKLVRGAVYVVKGGKKIAEISEPGEYFGEMAAITGEVRSASILSKGRSVIKRFPGDKLLDIIEKYPEVAKHLFTVLANRLNATDRTLVHRLNVGKNRPHK